MRYILALLFVLVTTPVFAQGKTINQLNPGAALTGTELMPMFQGGNPAVTTTPNAIKTFTNAGITSGTPGIISVTQSPYNAKCDSATDDTAAIQAAFNDAFPPLAGVITSQATTSILLIPGRCVITNTITARALVSGYQNNFIVQCTGAGTGLIWNGTDNTGTMLLFGDPTGIHQDGAFTIEGCYFDGRDASHKPNQVIEFKNISGWHVKNSDFSLPQNGRIHGGILCDSQNCELSEVYHSNFSCLDDCIKLVAPNNGTIIELNQFSACGRYCYEGIGDAVVTLFHNYFEGDKATSLGSIWIGGNGDRLIANTFEDNNLGAGVGFRSVIINGLAHDTKFYGNYYIGAGDGNYRIEIDDPADAEFFGEEGVSAGSSGFFIDNQSSGQSIVWHGGTHCNASTLFGGVEAFRTQLDYACGYLTRGVNGNYSIDSGGIGGNTAGVIIANAYGGGVNFGVPALSGTCSGDVNTQIGGTIGSFKGSAGCAGGTLTFTFGGLTMPNGWHCTAANTTSPTNLIVQIGYTTSTTTFTGSWLVNDQMTYGCLGF